MIFFIPTLQSSITFNLMTHVTFGFDKVLKSADFQLQSLKVGVYSEHQINLGSAELHVGICVLQYSDGPIQVNHGLHAIFPSFRIVLEHELLMPGSTLRGVLIFTNTEPQPCRAVRLIVCGYSFASRCQVHESDTNSENSSLVWLFRQRATLAGKVSNPNELQPKIRVGPSSVKSKSINDPNIVQVESHQTSSIENEVIEPGFHLWPFQFHLPMSIPPSWTNQPPVWTHFPSSSITHISYFVKGYLDVPMGMDVVTKKSWFWIGSNISLLPKSFIKARQTKWKTNFASTNSAKLWVSCPTIAQAEEKIPLMIQLKFSNHDSAAPPPKLNYLTCSLKFQMNKWLHYDNDDRFYHHEGEGGEVQILQETGTSFHIIPDSRWTKTLTKVCSESLHLDELNRMVQHAISKDGDETLELQHEFSVPAYGIVYSSITPTLCPNFQFNYFMEVLAHVEGYKSYFKVIFPIAIQANSPPIEKVERVLSPQYPNGVIMVSNPALPRKDNHHSSDDTEYEDVGRMIRSTMAPGKVHVTESGYQPMPHRGLPFNPKLFETTSIPPQIFDNTSPKTTALSYLTPWSTKIWKLGDYPRWVKDFDPIAPHVISCYNKEESTSSLQEY